MVQLNASTASTTTKAVTKADMASNADMTNDLVKVSGFLRELIA
jgi:hypothetical protein